MLYQLPSPRFGQTHADLVVEVHPRSVIVMGPLGVVQDGVFIPEPGVSGVHRVIDGNEFEAFLAKPIQRGLPIALAGNFRGPDLKDWLDRYGYTQALSSWTPTEE